MVRHRAGAGGPSGIDLLVGHWQAGVRELATRLTRHADAGGGSFVEDLLQRLGADEQVYLAPEAFMVDDPDGVALDVFSLGAIAYLLLTGRPPAADLVERERLLTEHRGLRLGAALPDVVEAVARQPRLRPRPARHPDRGGWWRPSGAPCR